MQTDDHGAVLLRLSGEDRVAVLGGAAGELGQDVGDGLGDAVDFGVIRVVEDDVAVHIDEHGAGARAVDILCPRDGIAVVFRRLQGDGELFAGDGLAREGNADHPRARAADAGHGLLLRGNRHVQIEGLRLAAGGRGDAQARTGRAGHERRHAAEGILRLRGAGVGGAIEEKVHMALAAHCLHHLRGGQAGDLLRICVCIRAAVAGRQRSGG